MFQNVGVLTKELKIAYSNFRATSQRGEDIEMVTHPKIWQMHLIKSWKKIFPQKELPKCMALMCELQLDFFSVLLTAYFFLDYSPEYTESLLNFS